MKRRLTWVMSLWLAFTVEIRVHASEKWLTEPENCQAGEPGCAWQARASRLSFVWSESQVAVEKWTTVTWLDGGVLELLKGTLLGDFKSGVRFRLPSATLEGSGTFLIDRSGAKAKIICLEGELRLRSLNGSQSLTLPAGYQVAVGPVMSGGRTQFELPQMAAIEPTVKRWYSLYQGPKEKFLDLAREFAGNVRNRVDRFTAWQYESVQREIASALEAEKRAREEKARQEREEAKLRALFRKLNYLGEDLPD